MNDAKETQSSWKNKIPKWGVVGLNGGKVEGSGYSGKIKDVSGSNLQDGCKKYGEFIMCLPCQTTSKFWHQAQKFRTKKFKFRDFSRPKQANFKFFDISLPIIVLLERLNGKHLVSEREIEKQTPLKMSHFVSVTHKGRVRVKGNYFRFRSRHCQKVHPNWFC